jgi:DNA-binding transcriptional LysR family regulator
MSRLEEAEIFVHVIKTGSFTAAASQLAVTKSHVSKQITRLEERLGTRLLQRSTRQLALTEPGQAYYERCVEALAAIDDAEDSATALQRRPQGTLRITVPASFGARHVEPLLTAFQLEHPQLLLDVLFADRFVDILAEGYDAALRWGVLPDSSLVAHKLASAYIVVCGSPAYLAAHGEPQRPEQLGAHACLRYAYNPEHDKWRLHGPEGEVAVAVSGPLRTNSGHHLVAAACQGLGLAYVPEFHAADALCAGTLRRVLPQWGDEKHLWALFPHARHLAVKVRVFVDFMVERLRSPTWCDWRQQAR